MIHLLTTTALSTFLYRRSVPLPILPPAPVDPDAALFIARNSTVPTEHQAAAYDYFVKQAKIIGAWSYITDCGFLCAQDATTARLGVKNNINLAVVGTAPSHVPGYGTRGNGSSQAFTTNYKFPAGQQDSAHLGIYSYTATGSDSGDIGNANSVIVPRGQGNDTAFSRINGTSAGSAPSLDAVGVFIANRSGPLTGDNKMFKRGVAIQTTTSASTTPDSVYNIWVGGRNGATPQYSSRTLSFWTIGTGMPDSIVAAYSLLIEEVCARLSSSITTATVTPQTRALYRYMTLMSRQPSYVLGAFDNTWWNLGTTPNLLSDIATITGGKVPALIGHEWADPLSVGGAAASAAQIARIKNHYAAGGIITVHMHPGNPVTGSFEQLPTTPGTAGNQYDMTGSPVVACLTGGSKRTEFLAFVDRLIAFFQACTDANGNPIPIIFRPWHEINGGFFWWTDGTQANTIQLWRDTVDRIKAAGVQNVLYSWNTNFAPTPSTGSYFPGMNYVDFVSTDVYENVTNPTGLISAETPLNGLSSATVMRPIYLGEIGFSGATDTNPGLWPTKVGGYHRDRLSRSASFMLWRSPFGPSAGGATNSEFAAMVADTACITRDRLIDVYTPIQVTAPVSTPPVLSSPTAIPSGSAGGLLTVSTTGTNGVLYWYVSTSTTPPSVANIKSGTGSVKYGTQAITASGPKLMTVAGLAVSTTYYAYFLHTNSSAIDSAVVASGSFVTDALPTFSSVTGFGDSMMAGSAATATGNRFLNLFATATGAGTIRNAGIGSTVLQNSIDAGGSARTDNGRNRFATATLGSNLSEVMINSYGYNDMRYVGAPATFNVTSFENDYNEIIAGQIAGGYARDKIYINSPFWVRDEILTGSVTPGFAPVPRSQVVQYAEACRKVALDWGVRFVDIYTATIDRLDLIDADGVHPNDAGHLFYKDLLLAARVINTRTALVGTATGGIDQIGLNITAPGDSPTSYTAQLINDSTNVLGSIITQVGSAFTFTSVAAGNYRVLFRANYADGTATPWTISSVVTSSLSATDSAITSIFSALEQGFWFDPSDITTLFQDTAGTVPVTTAGQLVARMNDKSGRGNHATQTTTASRPTYQIDGTGRGHLVFDGVDDFLVTGTVTPGSNASQVIAGIRKSSDAASGILVELSVGTGGLNGSLYINAPSLAGANSYRGGGLGTTFTQVGTGTFAPAPDQAVITFLASISTPIMQLRRNGTVVETSTATMGTGNFNAYPIYIGRRGGTSLPFNGRVYGLIWRFGPVLTTPQIEAAETWMNSKTGAY